MTRKTINKVLISVTFSIIGLYAFADIAPHPVVAKGISAKAKTEIKMTYEKVTVDLTLDSSFVHCYFKMHNEGKTTNIQIGYPNMNNSYYFWGRGSRNGMIKRLSNDSIYNGENQMNFSRINVYENGIETGKVDFYPLNYSFQLNDSNDGMPWYLWNTHFDKNETKIIEISYSLPRGIVKSNPYYYFNYLLSTGAGWKGNIDTAEVIINFRDFDPNLILKAEPSNYTLSDNKFVWKYLNFEPTEINDISIKYELNKGDYISKFNNIKLKEPIYFLNDKRTIINTNILEKRDSLIDIDPNLIASIHVTRNTKLIKAHINEFDTVINNCENGFVLIYTKSFFINKLNKLLRSQKNNKDTITCNALEFENKYLVRINNKYDSNFYNKILMANDDQIQDIVLRRKIFGKTEIGLKMQK